MEERAVAEQDPDLGNMLERIAATQVNRRGFLAAAGYTSLAAFLAACTGGAASTPGASAAPSVAPPSTEPSVAPSIAPTPRPSYKVESELLMYNWSNYISEDNIKAFKAEYGVKKFQYDIYDNNDVLMAKLQGGATGYDIAAPTNNYIPAMVEGGFLQKLDMSRIPNIQLINPTFRKGWWDPTEEYAVPKDYGTTGVLYRSKMIPSIPKTWREFYDLVKGPESGKVIFVDSRDDVFIFPLKMLGYSLNSVEKTELDEARTVLLDVAPHLFGLDSNTYGQTMADGQASMTLGWTGPLGQEMKDTPDKGYVVPEEGTAFWLDTWVMLANAPHPNISYAWLDFIQRPKVQGEESNYNLYATPNDAAKEFVKPEILKDTAIFPPADIISKLEAQKDTSSSTQRNDIWEEFKSKVGG
jgi:spermidine/putrescine transport system substrate-binding protein